MKNIVVTLVICLLCIKSFAQDEGQDYQKYKVVFKDNSEKIIDVIKIKDDKVYYWDDKQKRAILLKSDFKSIEIADDKSTVKNDMPSVEYKIEKIDTVSKSKDQIYVDTKMFIAEYWKSAINVIQNDDKLSGMVLIKGASIQHMYFQLNDHVYVFNYSVQFLMKEGRFKIIINNVSNTSAKCQTYDWPLITICDRCEYPGLRKTGLNLERYTNLQELVKNELKKIVDDYSIYIKVKSKKNTDW